MLREAIIVVLVILVSISKSISSDNYNVGDVLFIWAKSGLNLRSSPSVNSPIIGGLNFGTSIKVVEKSDLQFNIKLISETEPYAFVNTVDPINALGKWVKVTAGANLIGYLIDQYLLPLDPAQIFNDDPFINVELKVLSVDTTWKNPKIDIINENESKYCIKQYHPYKITTSKCIGGYESTIGFEFPNFSIEEVLIFFSSSNKNFESFSVRKYWKEEILLSDGEICEWRITRIGNITYVGIECSC